jgi:hypothetical protein
MVEHELKFPATNAGDRASEIKVRHLADDPNVYDLCLAERGSEGNLITYKTRH